MADTNPFAALVTPDMLAAQRQAQMQAQYGKAPLPTQMAAQAGSTIREGFRNAGYGLTAEDIKAQKTQEIMETAQKSYTDLVKDGKMSVDEAQAKTLEDAIKGFSAIGNWEAAISLSQPLNTLKEQALERRKLKADAEFLESKPEAKAQDQEIAALKNEQAYQAKLMQLELAAAKASDAATRMAYQNQLTAQQIEFLEWRMRNQTETGTKKSGKESVTQYKERIKVNETAAAAADSATLMANLRRQIVASPGALGPTGELASKIMTYGTAAKALVGKAGYNPDALVGGGTAAEWARKNVANATQRSLVVSLAYAFARANDPGGRLSNQDLELALKVVAGEGGPAAQIATLDQAFQTLAYSTTGKVLAAVDNDASLGKNSAKRWIEATKDYKTAIDSAPKPTVTAAGGPARTETAAERLKRLGL